MSSEEDRRVADCLHHHTRRRGGKWTADLKESEGELERRGDAGDAGDGGEGASRANGGGRHGVGGRGSRRRSWWSCRRECDAKCGREEGADAKCGREERRTRTEEGADLARLNDFFGSVNHAHVSQTRVYIGLFG